MARKILKRRRLWILTIVVFVLLLVFFDRNNFVDRREIRKDIEVLKARKTYYLERIEEDSTVLKKLENDAFLEQYARENFLMKRADDVVYILEP